MNAPFTVNAARSISELRDLFAGICERRADFFADGVLTLHEAVDELQAIASLTGLVEAIGQDKVQEIIGGGPPLVPDLADEVEAEIMLRAAAMVRDWELADPRDRWKHTGEPKPIDRPAVRQHTPPAPPSSTVAAFLYVAALDDVERLKAWLDDHRRDAPILLKLLESKLC
jgi:hypothetical protein